MKHEGMDKSLIEIVYIKNKFEKYYTGLGSYYLNWVRMKVPRPTQNQWCYGSDGRATELKEIPVEFDSIRFAQVLAHEFGHNRHLYHKEMCAVGDINTDYAEKFKVQPKQIIEKPKTYLIATRHELAKKKLAEYAAKTKRYVKLLKKWQKKVKYYENKKVMK
jgi:IS1 family transposase